MDLQKLKDLNEPITATISHVTVLKVGPRKQRTRKDGTPITFTLKTGEVIEPYERYFMITDASLLPEEDSTFDHGAMFITLNYTNEKRPVPEKGDKITITIKAEKWKEKIYFKGQRFDVEDV